LIDSVAMVDPKMGWEEGRLGMVLF
jgi:hypothetical protein